MKAQLFKVGKDFRGVELYGFTSSNIQTIDLGTVIRTSKWMRILSFHYRTDSLHFHYFGLGYCLQRYFTIPKIHLTPFIRTSIAFSIFKPAQANEKDATLIYNNANLSLGGGTYIELNKYIQLGGSFNYELVGVKGHKSYFDFLPLIHLKYEFHFK